MAAVIALPEGKSFWRVLAHTLSLRISYYLLGAAAAGSFEVTTRHLGWQTSMLVVPVKYLVYRSYRLYLRRLEDEKKDAEETAALHLRPLKCCRLPSKPRTTPLTITCSACKFTPSKPARNSRSTKTELLAVVGAEILARAQFPYSLAPIVRSHHEKWDARDIRTA